MEIFWSDIKKEVRTDIAESYGETEQGFSVKRNLDFIPLAVLEII